MLALLGFAIILIFLILIISKKVSVIVALVLTPVIIALIAGFKPLEIGQYSLEGIKQVAPTGILLMFAVLYFATMLDAGLFDPVISFIIRSVKGDPLKVILGTAILSMIVHLDGDGTATFMIVLSAFLPIYKALKINKLVLPGIVAMSVGPIHLVPWSGTSARALSVLETDSVHLFTPNLPAIGAGILWVLFVAWYWGMRERKKLGVIDFEYNHKEELTTDQKELRRPKLILINAILTVLLIVSLMEGWIPAPVLFVIASMLVLQINYPKLADQKKVLRSHGNNIFLVSSLIFAAGIFSGILNGSGMIDAMATSLVQLIPDEQSNFLPVLTAITSMPASLLFTPDAYYFGVLPVLSESASQLNMDTIQMGRAALLGQMTVGFPLSPLTASTFLLIGLAEVELGDHQRHTFLWAWGTTIVMAIVAVLTGSLSI
ncbi:CitMHS family transporter [Jiulongibacter sediminis]|uniref:Citrate transporter n=1 Tax=Jiulongibacter sediminis TaxID=1605367 RepID=A0A0P7B8X6_9BACT|nr:citrate:proton symporter [Jiulongibacter sediminis]KPM46766.1 citrate transporter [Jiulongibacter sediminis]TBX21670.1 citrate transporter [Jiulongibacter sediminis]